MAKNVTPEMKKINSQVNKRKKESYTPGQEALKRFKRNKLAIIGIIIVMIFILAAILADFIAPYGMDEQDYSAILQPPSAQHWMGTDNFGRDLFSRVIYGARISVPIGFICVITGLICGGGLGLLAGYYGNKVENIIMRIMDMFQAVPATLMSIAIVAALGNSIPNLVLAITIAGLPMYAKTTRAAIFTVKETEYVMAAKALGASPLRLMIRHMVPNAVGPIIVTATFSMASSILIVSGMSYLGLGIIAPTPEWGSILNYGKVYMLQAPWYVLWPGLMIALTVLALNLFGDGLRDALDPRLK